MLVSFILKYKNALIIIAILIILILAIRAYLNRDKSDEVSDAAGEAYNRETKKTPILPKSRLITIAAEIYEAIDGMGTGWEKLVRALSAIPTTADYYAVAKIYADTYGEDIRKAIMGDVSNEADLAQLNEIFRSKLIEVVL